MRVVFVLLALAASTVIPALDGRELSKSEWDDHVRMSMSLSEEDIAMHQIRGVAGKLKTRDDLFHNHTDPLLFDYTACNACENQMFDCSDSCDCAWGGSDIVQCMMCNSKCTAKKCAAYCAKIGQGGGRRLRGNTLL